MFTILIAGFCGYLTDINGDPFVTIGHIEDKQCVRPVLTIADGVTTLPQSTFRHKVHVKVTDTEAFVTVDSKMFRIPR